MNPEELLAEYVPGATSATWDGTTEGWSQAQRGALVEAIAGEWERLFGDPWSRAQQAAFVLAALFHDVHQENPAVTHIQMKSSSGDEVCQLNLRRSRTEQLPPIPSLNGAGAQVAGTPTHSNMTASVARMASPRSLVLDVESASRLLIEVQAQWPHLKPVLQFKAAAAWWALWRVLQVTGVLRGGALFRRLRHPEAASDAEGAVRVTFERDLPGSDEVLASALDGGAFLLNF